MSEFTKPDSSFIGATVKWYPSAQTHMPHMLGTIVDVFSNGGVMLTIVQRDGSHFGVDASYHKDDTENLRNKHDGKFKPHITSTGCWELTDFSKKVLGLGGAVVKVVEAALEVKEEEPTEVDTATLQPVEAVGDVVTEQDSNISLDVLLEHGIRKEAVDALLGAEVETLGKLVEKSDEELSSIKGIGEATLKAVREAQAKLLG